MKIKDIALSAAYVGQRVVKAICVGAQEIWSAVKYMLFADPVVEQICAENWGDGVGITEEQAAAVTDIGTVFSGNTEITSFNELQEFSITMLGADDSSSAGAFANCTNLSSVRVPEELTQFGYNCFDGCTNLTDINFPESVRYYERHSFNGTQVGGDVKIANAYRLGLSTFEGTNISSISIMSWVEELTQSQRRVQQSFAKGCKKLRAISLGNTYSIDDEAFEGCESLEDIDLISVQGIGRRAFHSSNLEGVELDLPSLKSWSYGAFTNTNIYKIKNLGSVINFGSNVSAGNAMFAGCTKLTEAILPATLTTVNNNVFSGCISMKTVVMNAVTPPTLGTGVFTSTPSDMLIYVPDQSVQAYRGASGWLDYADRIKPISQYVEP